MGVEVLASYEGHPVAIREGGVLACAFHPELTDDSRLHALFMAMTTSARERASTRRRRRERPQSGEPGEDPGRLLDQGESGRGGLDRRRGRRRAPAAGDLRRGAEGGRPPDPQRRPRRAGGDLLRERQRRAARVGLAADGVDGRQRRRADRRRRQRQHARTLEDPAGAPDPAPDRDRPGAEPDDGAQRRRRFPLVLHAVPDQRLRLGGRDEPRRLRGLLLRRLPRRRSRTR